MRSFEKAFTLKEVEIHCVPGACLTVSQLSTDLKDFFGKFCYHNYFDDASVNSNSATII